MEQPKKKRGRPTKSKQVTFPNDTLTNEGIPAATIVHDPVDANMFQPSLSLPEGAIDDFIPLADREEDDEPEIKEPEISQEELEALEAMANQNYLEEQKRIEREQKKIVENAKKNLAHSIADNIAQKTVHKVINDATQIGKQQEKLAKTVLASDLFEEEYIQNITILNGYKAEYKGKINFNFKPKYEAGVTDPLVVKQHLAEVRMILNGQAVPYLLNNFLDKGSEFISRTSVLMGIPWLNFSTFHQNVMAAKAQGFFDEEITQLGIELMAILGTDPKTRLLYKLGLIATNTWLENLPSHLYSNFAAEKLNKVDPKKVADLSKKYNQL